MNEVLCEAALTGANLDLTLGGGGFIGSSEGYRWLASAGVEWRKFLLPELSLEAEVKWVDFCRLCHEAGFSLALSPTVALFFRNARYYELRNASYMGLRLRSREEDDPILNTLNVQVGVSPFRERFKLEFEGGFHLEFFRNISRRLLAAIEFESPILNGDGFFAQFWPGKMIYEIGLDYEHVITPNLYAAWIARYRIDMPVDENAFFAASWFTGLALRNQLDFDVLEKKVRWEFAAGHNFKHGLEFDGRLGLGIWSGSRWKICTELTRQLDSDRLFLDLRLLAAGGGAVEWRPYVGWKKDIGIDPTQETPGKLLFGFGFFRKL